MKLAVIFIVLLVAVAMAGWFGYRATAEDRECFKTGTPKHYVGDDDPNTIDPGWSYSTEKIACK